MLKRLGWRFVWWLVKIGFIEARMICVECGREIEWQNADAHDAYFHPKGKKGQN